MKRLFFILLFFGALLMCGCQREYGILDYQNNEIEAQCLVNGEYTVALHKNGDKCTLKIKEPQYANGIEFELFGDSATAIAKGTRIEMDIDDLGGVAAIAEIFSQKEECMINASKTEAGSVLTFQTESCLYEITMGEGSLPKHVEIVSESFKYSIEIQAIEIKSHS